jgi:hypothetical protein
MNRDKQPAYKDLSVCVPVKMHLLGFKTLLVVVSQLPLLNILNRFTVNGHFRNRCRSNSVF